MQGGLYALVDPTAMGGRDPLAVARAILHGGCAVLQLRWKDASDRERLRLARALRAECAAHGVPFVVNDRPDLVVLSDAEGLHLGQDDLPIADARRVVGEGVQIGRSTHDEAQAERAAAEGADLIAFGPVFATGSKRDAAPIVGLERLAAVCQKSAVPVVAIGGIDLARAPAVRKAGATFGAAISALSTADDPRGAARALHRALGGGA